MIKFELDFRNATQAEIDAFYAIDGMQSAIDHLQTNNRKYNTALTVLSPGDQLVEVKALIMAFMRERKMAVGNAIPAKPFTFSFLPGLNPKQGALVDSALESFVSEDVLSKKGGDYFLTAHGLEILY